MLTPEVFFLLLKLPALQRQAAANAEVFLSVPNWHGTGGTDDTLWCDLDVRSTTKAIDYHARLLATMQGPAQLWAKQQAGRLLGWELLNDVPSLIANRDCDRGLTVWELTLPHFCKAKFVAAGKSGDSAYQEVPGLDPNWKQPEIAAALAAILLFLSNHPNPQKCDW